MVIALNTYKLLKPLKNVGKNPLPNIGKSLSKLKPWILEANIKTILKTSIGKIIKVALIIDFIPNMLHATIANVNIESKNIVG